MTTASEIWSRLLNHARSDQHLGPNVTKTWLELIIPIRFEDHTLYVSTPDQLSLDWIESKYVDFLRNLAPVVCGYSLNIILQVDPERQNRPQLDLFATPSVSPKLSPSLYHQRPTLSNRYTFDQFVIGKSNELAAATAHAIAQAPGRNFNPFFIYGETGLGKTHLMQAIAQDVLLRHPNIRVTYLGAEQFMNEFILSIATRTNTAFRRRFREADFLLVDDIHFLKGKEGTQEEFFHTFNALFEAGRQIVLTSDRSPSDISGLEARLVSRFRWGMVADMQTPELEHRIAILQKKTTLDHLQTTLSPDVIHFIAATIDSNVRELEGAIIRLLAYASLKHRSIDLQLAHEVLSRETVKNSTATSSQLSILQIQDLVAAAWGITTADLCSKLRTRALTIPRQIAIFLCRDLLALQLVEIGKAFGNRDHSTVLHSLNRALHFIEHDPTVQLRVKNIKLHLQSS